MKTKIILQIRKILYVIINHIHFPSTKVKNKNLTQLEDKYKNKKVDIVENGFSLDTNINLSFVVPVYNSESLIAKCAESLINQETKYRYNIIFVNDGSTDKSLEILKKYQRKNNNLIKIITQKNTGIAGARNKGLQYITGEYVSFVDSDDFITKDFVEKVLNAAYKNNSEIVRTNYYEYSVDDNKIIKTGPNYENKKYTSGLGKDILLYKGYPWGGVFKSELWRNIEFPKKFWYEDMIIRMILFQKANSFSYINDKLYYYCLHKNNISKKIEKTKDSRCLDHLFLIEKLYHLSEKLKINDKESLYKNMIYEYSVVLWLRTRGINKKFRKAVFTKACNIINNININCNPTKEEKIIITAFKNYDYVSWELYAIYKMISVKFGVE